MVDRVIEALDIIGAVFALAFILGVEIGKRQERKHWAQFGKHR